MVFLVSNSLKPAGLVVNLPKKSTQPMLISYKSANVGGEKSGN